MRNDVVGLGHCRTFGARGESRANIGGGLARRKGRAPPETGVRSVRAAKAVRKSAAGLRTAKAAPTSQSAPQMAASGRRPTTLNYEL